MVRARPPIIQRFAKSTLTVLSLAAMLRESPEPGAESCLGTISKLSKQGIPVRCGSASRPKMLAPITITKPNSLRGTSIFSNRNLSQPSQPQNLLSTSCTFQEGKGLICRKVKMTTISLDVYRVP